MSETTQLTSNNTEFEYDCEEEIEPLNKSLTSMDWLQKLNADYITQTNSESVQWKKKFPSRKEDNQNSCSSSGTKFSTEESLENQTTLDHRAVGRSENPGVPVLFGGHNLPPLVEIGSRIYKGRIDGDSYYTM